jgi:hypothetical protein
MKTKLIQILDLPSNASEADIIKAVTELVAERRHAKDGAAFESRIAALVKLTNQSREDAILTISQQDASAKQLI